MQILWTHLYFDSLIQDNDVDIAELIIPIWSLSVKSNNIVLGKEHSKKVYGNEIIEGVRVLACNLLEWGDNGKLQSYWGKDFHVVVEGVKDLPIFQVKCENSENGRIWTLPRNLLLKCNKLPTQPQLNKYTHPRKNNSIMNTYIPKTLQWFFLGRFASYYCKKKQKKQPNRENTEREEKGEISLVNQNLNHVFTNSLS